MGDIFGGQKEDTSQQDAMNRQMAMQEKRKLIWKQKKKRKEDLGVEVEGL